MEPRTTNRIFANALPVHDKASLFDILYRTAMGNLGEWLAPSLWHAARVGNVDLMRTLLGLGASPDTTWSNGDCVLHQVAAAGNQEAVRALLQHGALVDKIDGRRRTALQLAAIYGHPHTAAALLEFGARAGYRRRARGSTPLELAAQFGFVDVIDTLVQHGANVDAANSERFTALHRAAAGGHVGAISALVGARASINAPGPHGMTPLHLASDENKPESVRVLCALRADKHKLDWLGRAPLHCATYRGNHNVLVALLNAGTDLDLREGGNPNWVNSSALDLAVEGGHMAILKTLIQRGADTNTADARGSTALHTAAHKNWSEAIDVLVQSGANLDATDLDGQTPLHRASRGMEVEAARALLGHGASVNTPDARGQSPLHWAASASLQDSSAQIVALLLRWDANEGAVDQHGHTPAGVVGRDAQELYPAGHLQPNINPSVLDQLAQAAADRAWRRRRVPVMCRARFDREQQNAPERADGASRQACGMMTRKRAKLAVLGEGGDVGARVVRMDEEDVFRHMMTFL